MAFVLKEPHGDSPGVIVFTHKEWRFFTASRRHLKKAIAQLKQNYLFAMHWGSYAANINSPPDIDFHLAGPGTLSLHGDTPARRIPLCSRNFLPAVFKPDGGEKYWDIISVGRPLRLKNFNELFAVVKRILAVRPQTRALFICPDVPDPNPSFHHVDIATDYRRIFTEQERENVTLLALSPALYPFPLSQTAMAYFYNRSRLFTLLSDVEGESRVVSEALLCGLPVFVKAGLLGGGRDHLDATNSCQFSDADAATAMFLDALEGRRTFKLDGRALREALSAEHNVPVLVDAIGRIFADAGRPFAGPLDTEGLDRKLPGHACLLPQDIGSGVTDDISSEAAFVRFSNRLTGGRVSAPSPAALMGAKMRRGLRAGAARLSSSLRKTART